MKQKGELSGLHYLGEPSWLILWVLNKSGESGLTNVEITAELRKILVQSQQPRNNFLASTFHYALIRLNRRGLIRESEKYRETEIPGPWGTTNRACRPVFFITPLGVKAIETKMRLYRLLV